MEFQQYLGFLAFLAIFTMGFWLMIFLAIVAPYWASSYVLQKIKEFERKFPDQNNVPRPTHWSGWRLLPEEIEFWLDGEGRIHERLNYRKKNGNWEKELLYP